MINNRERGKPKLSPEKEDILGWTDTITIGREGIM